MHYAILFLSPLRVHKRKDYLQTSLSTPPSPPPRFSSPFSEGKTPRRIYDAHVPLDLHRSFEPSSPRPLITRNIIKLIKGCFIESVSYAPRSNLIQLIMRMFVFRLADACFTYYLRRPSLLLGRN